MFESTKKCFFFLKSVICCNFIQNFNLVAKFEKSSLIILKLKSYDASNHPEPLVTLAYFRQHPVGSKRPAETRPNTKSRFWSKKNWDVEANEKILGFSMLAISNF